MHQIKALASNTRKLLYVTLTVLVFGSCSAQSVPSSPAGYNLSAPVKTELPDNIDEISGMAWNEADKSIYAIDDNEGKLFRLSNLSKLVVDELDAGVAKDFEDVVIANGKIYILQSKGAILSFPFPKPDGTPLEVKLDVGGGNEFESLYNDGKGHLILLCKGCKSDGKERSSAYQYDLSTNTFNNDPSMSLDTRSLGTVKGKFKPSAASINPVTGELFIISSVNKLLVVTDAQLKVKGTYPLDPTLFKQPEGICFTPSGDMYISNEAAGNGPANILFFRRK